MNDLDSRVLHYGDTFAQRFGKAGAVTYLVGPAGSKQFGGLEGFKIRVKPAAAGAKAKQHNVVIRAKGGQLVADPPSLEIEAGDIVLWSATEATTPGFRVSGRSEAGAFDSGALESESVYTHAFGLAGEYEWRDAHGRKVSGVVKVTNPVMETQEHGERYDKLLTTGTLVVIRGDTADPKAVEIYTGQTVFFAVEKAPGITITDRRLLQRG